MKAHCDVDVARPAAPRPLPFYGCLTWVIGLVPKARQAGGLKETDIPNLSDSLRSEEALAAAASGWNDQVLRRKRPSLLRVLLSMNCFTVSVNVVVGVMMSFTQCLARPLAVRLMVRAVKNQKGPSDAVPELVCVGVVIFLEGFFWMITRHAACDIGGTRTMAAISGLVVTKATRLLDSSKKTSDEKVLVAVDAIGKVNSAFSILSFFVSNALGVFIGSGVALYIVGPATFAGIVVGIIGMLTTHTSGSAAGRYDKIAIENGEQRMRTLNEILANIKGVKIHAWEDQFLDRMESFRAKETWAYKLWHKTRSLGVNLGRSLPALCSCATFCTFALNGGTLTPEVIFPVLAVFQGMRMPMVLLPMNLVFLKTFTISLHRIETFLLASEAPALSPLCKGDALARLDNAKLGFWSEDSFTAVLSDLCCDFEADQIVGVVGPVASGKSSLLLGLLGEFPLEAGTASSIASVGFAPQKPMVISGTLAENIYVGREPDANRLAKVLRMCCLEEDLPSLVDGIETEIGERGVTLSGGQQQRLAIARAMYGSPKLLVLDDPLSAVDVRTGAALMSSLAAYAHSGEGCGVVMVVNQPHCLYQCDKLVILGDGGVIATGPPAEVFAGGCPKGASQRSAEFFSSMAVAALAPQLAVDPCDGVDMREQRGHDLEGQKGSLQDTQKDIQKERPASLRKNHTTLVKDDVRQSGAMKRNVYWDLIDSIRLPRLLGVLLLFILAHGFYVANDLWLIHWTQGGAETAVGVVVLTALTLGYSIGASCAALLWYSAAAAAGRRIFRDCMLAVLRAPVGWFDETPSGRITSRFSGDLNGIDVQFAQFAEALGQFLFLAVAVLVTSMYLNIYFVFIAAAYMTSVFCVFRQVEALNRDTKRLCNLALSPVLTNISELRACRQSGLLRPMGLQSFFLTRHNRCMEAYGRCWFTNQSLLTWANFAFYSLSALMSAASAVAILQGNPSPESAGLQIVYCFILPFCVNLMVLLYFVVSVTLTQLERLFEMKDVPQEATQGSLGYPSALSIADGSISFRGASLRYKPDLPPSLDNVNLEIPSGSRVGLCGRTGSGKSSMMVMLLRLVELEKGSIFLGGQSLKDIGLSALRRAIAMIPQEPFLMQGSVRQNLDPFGDRGDEEIASALQRVGLKCGLDDPVGSGGSNLSAGERQLLSFSRILLRDSKVVLLDEPTSSLDPMTDAKMGELVRSACCGRTVLTIAHRLKTILDSDLVVVLANGSIVESGSPEELLQRPDSQYSQMLQLSGEKQVDGSDANPGVWNELSI